MTLRFYWPMRHFLRRNHHPNGMGPAICNSRRLKPLTSRASYTVAIQLQGTLRETPVVDESWWPGWFKLRVSSTNDNRWRSQFLQNGYSLVYSGAICVSNKKFHNVSLTRKIGNLETGMKFWEDPTQSPHSLWRATSWFGQISQLDMSVLGVIFLST